MTMHNGRRPAVAYLWVWGAVLVILGGAGLALHPDFAVGRGVSHEHLFGVFETNGWHSVAGLAFGIPSLVVASRAPGWAPATALAVGLFGGVVPAASFAAVGDGGVFLGLIPVDIADAVALHLLPGLLGVAAAIPGLRAGRLPGLLGATRGTDNPRAAA
jgi:hypothetical protein